MKVFKKLRGWISRHSWVKWVFSGVGVFVVAGILAAMSLKSHERPLIEQRTEGANSPNVVGNNNVLSYQAEPNERSLSPRFANALSPFAGQRFWIVAQTNDWDEASEQVRFARVIDSGLQAARWNKTQNITMKHRGSTEFREVPQPLYARISDRGVIVYAAESALGAGAALRDELRRGPNKAELASDNNLKEAIVIVVGLQ